MPQSLRHIALIASVALGMSIIAPATLSPRAAAESTSNDRLTRTVRALADRAEPQSPDAPAAPTTPDSAEAPQHPEPREQPERAGSDATSEDAPVASPDRPLTSDHVAAPETDRNELRRLGAAFEGEQDEDRGLSGAGDASWVLQTVTALGIVVGLLLLLRWGWMRLSGTQGASPSPVVEVLSRTPVAPRNHVLLLRVGPRILIVGDSTAGLRTLGSVEDEQEVADLLASVNAARPDSISRNFQQLLGRFGAAHDAEAQSSPFESAQGDPWHAADDGRDHAEHLFDRTRNNLSGLASRIRTLSRKGGRP